jgi:phosphate uptake regulator
METRKVQLSGGSTYTISLPKAWAEAHGIDTGSVLFLYPRENGTLQVANSQQSADATWSRTLSVGSLSARQVRNRLIALYAIGAEEITVRDRTGLDDATRDAVTDTMAGFTGLEVIRADDTTLTLRNLAGPGNLDIRKSTLRLRLVTLSMYRDAVAALLSSDSDLAETVVERDTEADKLFALLTRHFRRAISSLEEVRQLGYGRQELFEYYYVGRQLERVADHAERIAHLTLEVDADVPDEFRGEVESLAERAEHGVESASEVLVGTADVETVDRVLDRRGSILEDVNQLDRALYDHGDAAEAHHVGRLLDSIRRTVAHSDNVARIVLQQSLRQADS